MGCGVLYSFHTSEEQAVLLLDSDWSYCPFCHHIVYGVFSVISVGENLIPEVFQIVKGLAHKFASVLIGICQQIIILCSYLLDDFRCSLIVPSAVNLVCGKFLPCRIICYQLKEYSYFKFSTKVRKRYMLVNTLILEDYDFYGLLL